MGDHIQQSRDSFLAGVRHFEAGRLQEARISFERSASLTPERPSVLGNLGITLFRLGKVAQAVQYLESATKGDPGFGDAWATLGLAYEALGEWELATEALSKALAITRERPNVWLSKGQCHMRLGRVADALQAFDQAIALDPGLAAAWSARGGLLREMHRLDEAAKCFETAAALGADPDLHSYYLASVTGGSPPAAAPRQYVEALFDEYAADFQSHLVEKLGYRGFERLLRPVVESGTRFGTAIDLGCGTGLCGPLLKACTDAIDGIDISREMLKQAEKLGVYRELIHADLIEFLRSSERRADLVVATDVLIYIGDLSSVFRSVSRILKSGGLFAFTVELATGAREFEWLPSLRYAHAETYIRRLAEHNGLAVQSLRTETVRHEQLKPVQGLYVYLQSPQ